MRINARAVGAIVVGCVGLVGCSSAPPIPNEPLARRTIQSLTLLGDGQAVSLKGAPANAAYRATYPLKNVDRLVARVGADGRLRATCTRAGVSGPCTATPFVTRITNEAAGHRTRVFDAFGALVIDTGSTSDGVPGSGTSDGVSGSGTSDGVAGSGTSDGAGGEGNTGDGEPGPLAPGSSCGEPSAPQSDCSPTKRAEFCASVNKWLAGHGISGTLDCAKLDGDESAIWNKPGLPTPTSDVPCHDILLPDDGSASAFDCNWYQNAQLQLVLLGACSYSPLVLDLDGDGLDLGTPEDGVSFDLLGSGARIRTAWPRGGDAFLAIDWNRNGAIDGAAELFGQASFGRRYDDGFKALAELDTNGDGVIDARDAAFAELVVWRDKNRDGVSQPDEMESLRDAGITALALSPVRQDGPGSFDRHGNRIPLVSTFVSSGGRRGLLADAFLRYKP